MHNAPCTLHYAHCIMHIAFCTLHYASMYHARCTSRFLRVYLSFSSSWILNVLRRQTHCQYEYWRWKTVCIFIFNSIQTSYSSFNCHRSTPQFIFYSFYSYFIVTVRLKSCDVIACDTSSIKHSLLGHMDGEICQWLFGLAACKGPFQKYRPFRGRSWYQCNCKRKDSLLYHRSPEYGKMK